ncbi:uncharacterized protein BO88DRAFT_136125 [Aspergillus vadensis CBS 113365]|uniref:Transmembrane protein n=1 Tax=Aspergillus vadensis (strain CBS 113365 / IMI 142717 / IBT 24658) TaxID=1448311 RepID=A0A319BIW5_ASPVC|nr:hypothetical protein BO88DRAFT_136125 [Aspergillus vadensis CBS 113365]PYH65693.1 hypothetical protein BO88DRAFT_136125 [Aspergillus vadensis CBS 113365]
MVRQSRRSSMGWLGGKERSRWRNKKKKKVRKKRGNPWPTESGSFARLTSSRSTLSLTLSLLAVALQPVIFSPSPVRFLTSFSSLFIRFVIFLFFVILFVLGFYSSPSLLNPSDPSSDRSPRFFYSRSSFRPFRSARYLVPSSLFPSLALIDE